jgi:soluble P-type ATPase
MSLDLAVVFDVAGTILKMYRAAKDIRKGCLMENIITSDLIMEKEGRALVVPQIGPEEIISYPSERLISSIFKDAFIEVSCCSTPVSKEEAVQIIRSSKARIGDIQEVYHAVTARCPGLYRTAGVIVDLDLMEISYAICTAGKPFPGLSDVLRELFVIGADIYIASGDSMRSLKSLVDHGFRPDHIFPLSSPRRKREIVSGLMQRYRVVVMVGDGLNDLAAIEAADLGVLTVQQDSHPLQCLFQAADTVIRDIRELPKLLE